MDKFCRKLEKKERNESHVFLRFRSSQFLELLVGTGKEKERLYIYIYTRKYNIYEYRDDNYITDVSFNVRRACGINKKKKKFDAMRNQRQRSLLIKTQFLGESKLACAFVKPIRFT